MSVLEDQRIDQCLFHLRFFKTRAMAQALIEKGRIRVNGERVRKSSRKVRVGDILVFPQGDQIRSVKLLGFCEAREAATIAQVNYEDIQLNAADTPRFSLEGQTRSA